MIDVLYLITLYNVSASKERPQQQIMLVGFAVKFISARKFEDVMDFVQFHCSSTAWLSYFHVM